MAEYIVEARASDLFGVKMKGNLVRCKDCKKCQAVNRRNLPPGMYCPVICADVEPTWYCANGVRMDGDGE